MTTIDRDARRPPHLSRRRLTVADAKEIVAGLRSALPPEKQYAQPRRTRAATRVSANRPVSAGANADAPFAAAEVRHA